MNIAASVKAHGAVYEGDLTKAITHLISFRTDGAKYKAAKQWGLRIVSAEWIRDSIERGMILEEKLYDPTCPPAERGIGAWDRTKPNRTSLGKRSRDSNNTVEGSKRKLRRTASTKLNSQSDGIWGDIVGGNMVAQVRRSGVWETDDSGTLSISTRPSLREHETASSRLTSVHPPAQRVPVKHGIFAGCRFYIHGFVEKRLEILHGHLTSNDGEVASTIEDLVISSENGTARLFRIVPHDLPVSSYPPLPESQVIIETVTFWWVEICLHRKKFQEPNDHVIGRPFPAFPIEGFNDGSMSICSSAFTGIDLLHLKSAVRLIGATYSEDMTPHSSVLVTKDMKSVRKDKFDHAMEWKVPLVTADWLWDSISSSKQLSYTKYRCRTQKRSGSLPVTAAPTTTTSRHSERSKSAITRPIPPMVEEVQPEPPVESPALNEASLKTKSDIVLQMGPPPDPSDATTAELSYTVSYKNEPLTERNLNSPTRTVSTAPAPSCHPAPPQPSKFDTEISSLLNKAKSTAPETTQTRKRTNRILGRATSNISAASSSLSRATSVDSTVNTGHAPAALKDQASNERMEMLLNNDDRKRRAEEETQPSMTQLEYIDPEAETAREAVLARMMPEGEGGVKRKRGRERAVTMGDLMGTGQKRVTRRSGGKVEK